MMQPFRGYDKLVLIILGVLGTLALLALCLDIYIASR